MYRGACRSSWCRCCWCRWRSARCSRPDRTASRRRWRRCWRWLAARPCCCWTTRRHSTISRRSTRRCTRRTPRSLAAVHSPRGDYMLLDDFTERVDTDISNNAGMLGVPGPPRSFGLYRDGNRIAALPKPGAGRRRLCRRRRWTRCPITLIPHAHVLLAGASGGFRIAEALRARRRHVACWSRSRSCCGALRDGLGPSPPLPTRDPACGRSGDGPLAARRGGPVRPDRHLRPTSSMPPRPTPRAFTAEAIAAYLRALTPGGIVSIPVSIRDFPVYALRMLATVRAGAAGGRHRRPGRRMSSSIARPGTCASCCRRTPLDAARDRRRRANSATTARSTCPAIPASTSPRRAPNIYNDLPAVSFDEGEVDVGDGPDDAIADEAEAVLAGQPTASREQFNLSPITLDRPFFYAVLRLAQLGTILQAAGNPAAGRDRRAGQSGRAGAGGGDRRCWCCWCRCSAPGRIRAPGGRHAARRSSISPRSAWASCSSRSI